MDTVFIILSLLMIAVCVPLTIKILSDGYVWTAAGVFGIMILVEACLIFTSVTQSYKIQYDVSYDVEGNLIIFDTAISEDECADVDKIDKSIKK